MKKALLLFFAILTAALMLCVGVCGVENEVSVTLDGFVVPFDVPGRIIGDRTMVPVRKIFEVLGADVEWKGETREIVATRDDLEIKLAVGSNELYKNGELVYTMDVSPLIIEEAGESRTLVPARAVSEAFGCKVDWDAEARTAIIQNITDETLMTIGDFTIDRDMYSYFALNTIGSLELNELLNEADIETFKSEVLERMLELYSAVDFASKLGYSIYDDATSEIVDSALAQYKLYYGESFEAILAASGMTEAVFERMLYYTYFENSVCGAIANEYDALDNETKVSLLYNGDDFIRAVHILTTDEKIAQELLERAKAASDEEFLALASEYGTDPGMSGNTDGYYFSRGQMLTEFEDAAFALSENETSGVVRSNVGYHIIRRLPKDKAYIESNIAGIVSSLAMTDYYNAVMSNKVLLAQEVVYTSAFSASDIYNDLILPVYLTDKDVSNELTGIPASDEDSFDEAPQSTTEKDDLLKVMM